MIDFKESDWKHLRRLKPILLERACAQINREAEILLINKKNLSHHEVYQSLYKHYHRKDKVIADCFDDHRRSRAIVKILYLIKYRFITDEEFEGFSSELKEHIREINR